MMPDLDLEKLEQAAAEYLADVREGADVKLRESILDMSGRLQELKKSPKFVRIAASCFNSSVETVDNSSDDRAAEAIGASIFASVATGFLVGLYYARLAAAGSRGQAIDGKVEP